MSWSDDEFEALLRQFRPRRPGALPADRRRVGALAAAAIVAAAVAIPAWYGWHGPAGAPASAPVSPPPGGNTPAASSAPVGAAAGAADRRLRVGRPIRPPVKLVHVAPVYPPDAQAAGIAGVVILDIVIAEDGSVIEASVLRSIPELDQAAIDAVSQWQFEPTLLNGEPVEVEMTVTINFTLSR